MVRRLSAMQYGTGGDRTDPLPIPSAASNPPAVERDPAGANAINTAPQARAELKSHKPAASAAMAVPHAHQTHPYGIGVM